VENYVSTFLDGSVKFDDMGMKDVEVKISLHNDYYCMNCERSDLVEEFYQNLTNLIMIEPYHYSGGKTTKLGND
jgi:hypothetical protein